MTASQKVSVSLLISVILFAAFSVIAFTGLFDLIETRFYNPSITKQALREITADANLVDAYIKEVQNRFSDLLKIPAVQRSFLPNQSAEDIFERSKTTGLLLEATSGLQWIRFIDVGGKRIHYSTLRDDILRQDATSLAYKNYGENPQDPPFDLINIPETGSNRIIGDANQERLLFCFPFYDSFSVYRGTAVFSLSIRSVTERMIREGRLRMGEEVALIAEPLGFVTGLPRSGKTVLLATIGSSWKDGNLGPVPLTSDNGSRFALLSVKTESSLLVGRLMDDRLFVFPFAMKLILLGSFFLTSFLLVFLLFNLEQDTITIVRERLKRLQLSLLEEYYDKKESIDWSRWAREMEQRREAIRGELKRGLPRKPKKKLEQDIDNLIDKSWDEIITILGGKAVPQVTATFDEGKLQELLNRLLSTVNTQPAAGTQTRPERPAVQTTIPASPKKQEMPVPQQHAAAASAAPIPQGGEQKPAVEAAEVEELAEAEAEAVEEVPEAVEDAEPVEELAEVPEAEAVEELVEAEPVEELAEVEEVPAEELTEELEEVPEAEPVEELAEAEAEAVEEVPEAVEDAEPVEELAEVPEAEAVEELVEAEPVEELAEVEEVPAEELTEELPGAESVEALEDIKQYQQKSNIRIVFGEDDIPTIIETSGLELVDSDEASVMAILEQKKTKELEELEAIPEEDKEKEALSELEETAELSEKASQKPIDMEILIDQIASKIEFSPFPETSESSNTEVQDISFEIVSPFDTILAQLKQPIMEQETEITNQEALTEAEKIEEVVEQETEEQGKITELESISEIDEPEVIQGDHQDVVQELESLKPSPTQLIMYRPFSNGVKTDPPLLEKADNTVEEETEEAEELINLEELEHDEENAIVEDSNGLLYIASTVYKEAPQKTKELNPDLQKLVDSVLSVPKS